MQWARGKYSTVVSGAIIGFIAFVFIVSGVFNPKSTRGLHEGAVAGTVNGDPISIAEFNRALNQRMEFFKNMGGGKFTDEQLKQFRVKEGVFQDLVRRKLMVQESSKQSMEASDEEVRDRIREIPAFQKESKFDLATYKQVLEANQYTVGSFERMVREDISMQGWQSYFQARVKVADAELKQQFLLTQDKRDIKYVLLTTEAGRQGVQIDPKEMEKFLADPAKLNLAKSQFEMKKDKEFKGMAFDIAKNQIARDILASEKTGEIKKVNEKLGDEAVALLTADKSSDAKVNALLKTYHVEVKKTGFVTRQSSYIPGVGEAKELLADAFAAKSPIDPAQGGKAKKYVSANWVLVALVTEAQKPDLAKLATERGQLIRQITTRKQREIYDEWLKKLVAKAKIDTNPAVVGEGA
ncbi:SurA N-terminal domain-containing protein [Bdellovibrionota bacterium FG-1]